MGAGHLDSFPDECWVTLILSEDSQKLTAGLHQSSRAQPSLARGRGMGSWEGLCEGEQTATSGGQASLELFGGPGQRTLRPFFFKPKLYKCG